MLLPLPKLDDTRWADLVEEGRALIPVYAPEWTDHNVSDPGITIGDLAAWRAEQLIFESDQVPARHRRRFLALVGVEPIPPRPARTVVQLALDPGQPPLALPAGLVCEAPTDDGEVVEFRTLDAVTVVAARIQTIEAATPSGTLDLTQRWRRGEPFAPFGADPRPGAALVLDLDSPLPPGERVSLAITCATDRAGAEERDRIAEPSVHHAARTVWERCDGSGRWRTLDARAGEASDHTRALTLDGLVEIAVPVPTARLRCRFVSGSYDDALRLADLTLNGVVARQAVPAASRWELAVGAQVVGQPTPGATIRLGVELDRDLRVSRLDVAEEGAPQVLVLGYRAPMAETPGVLTVEAALAGIGTGLAGQAVTLEPAPVEADSVLLWTREGAGAQPEWRSWMLRSDLESARPDEPCAVVDGTTGEVGFGDGQRGLAPPEGATIVASHRSTLAERGNLGVGAISVLREAGDASATVRNRVPATGGAAAESIEHAQGRAGQLVAELNRAVTPDDIGELALRTPGVRLARTSAHANLHPAFPCVVATGVTTVIVVPYLPAGRPVPSRGLLRAVAAHLESRRLIGSRIEVTGPRYTEVSIRATVRARALADPAEVRSRVAGRLDEFLDPLSGGQDRHGWPFGRDVVRPEVLRLIDEVPGVDHVVALELLSPDGASCGNLCIGALGLVHPGEHVLEVVTG